MPNRTSPTRPRDPHDWVETWAWPILQRGPMPGGADRVLLRLAAYGNREGIAWPSVDTLADDTGYKPTPVRKALKFLAREGFIDGDPRPGRVTRWRFVTDETEQRALAAGEPSRVRISREPRPNLAPTSPPVGDEGEGEVEEKNKKASSPSTSLGDVETSSFEKNGETTNGRRRGPRSISEVLSAIVKDATDNTNATGSTNNTNTNGGHSGNASVDATGSTPPTSLAYRSAYGDGA